jgi:hypothetical protein
MNKKLLATLACMCLIMYARAQEFRFGINLFPVNTYQLKYDKPAFILPDYTSVKVDESMRVSARKVYLTGLYFRVNWGHVMLKTELNYFNRFFNIGNTTIPQEYSSDPYKLTIRYMTFEVPLYVGYTLKPNGKFRVTPFVGISSELGKMKPLIPPVMKTFEDKSTERVYGELFDQKALLPSTLINYAAGVEIIYYGVLLQVAAKQNATPVFNHNPNNANPTTLTMIECTVGFGIHKGGFAHSIFKRWK